MVITWIYLSIYLGSSPSAVITWWKDGQYLDRPMEFVEENRTVSSVIQVNINFLFVDF